MLLVPFRPSRILSESDMLHDQHGIYSSIDRQTDIKVCHTAFYTHNVIFCKLFHSNTIAGEPLLKRYDVAVEHFIRIGKTSGSTIVRIRQCDIIFV